MALFRNWSVVNFAQIGEGRLSWGLFSKINSLVTIFSAFSAPHGKSRSPKPDLPTLLKMRRTAPLYQEHAGRAERADISHVRMHVRQQNLDFPEDVIAVQALADGSGMAVLARHHDADDCNSRSDQPPSPAAIDGSHRVVALDQNLERAKAEYQRNGPNSGKLRPS